MANGDKKPGERAEVNVARQAMLLLTESERAALHTELGCCVCTAAAQAAIRDPDVVLGAVLGGGLALLFRRVRKNDTSAVEPTAKTAHCRQVLCNASGQVCKCPCTNCLLLRAAPSALKPPWER